VPGVYLHIPPIGIGPEDNFFYDGSRPAAHCRICGESFQPDLARSPHFEQDSEIQLAVILLLQEWRAKHNNTHKPQEHLHLHESGNLMTPQAAIKLIPLGIYPLQDIVADEEIAQAGREAPRAPQDDIRSKL
jgi:hypothetical protein